MTIDFGNAAFESCSIISPDNTPMYDFHILNSDGHPKVAASSIDATPALIYQRFTLIGLNTIKITNAVDAGSYSVQLNLRP